MSAYLVDPETVDYLLAWALQHRAQQDTALAYRDVTVPSDAPDLAPYRAAQSPCLTDHKSEWGDRTTWRIGTSEDQTGQLLFDQNLRSIEARYPDTVDNPENAPGPCDQSRIRGYHYRPIRPTIELRPAWVITCCNCWRYQSCETEDHENTAAWALVTAIRESAIAALVKVTDERAPWGITAGLLAEQDAIRVGIRAKVKLQLEA